MPQYLADINGDKFTLSQDETRHIKVARLRAGDEIKIFDGRGRKFLAALGDISAKSAVGALIKELPVPAPRRAVMLYFSAISRPATEDLLDKCTQAGAFAFRPVVSARSDADLLKKWDTKLARWQSILLAACKQCENPKIPQICAPLTFAEAIKTAAAAPALICYEDEHKTNILDALAGCAAAEISIFTGPEGGYTPEEIKAAVAAGIKPVSLGRNILRAETAAAAAVWAAMQ
ncbi:MAG: 16S rRNA (uracil(1498)-N(3))-methyltransferase [Elusimicrobiota bacterium]|jgi:16S rRNA (uracil1498-N3)-methyltransferase|nr:16S rRNA (uracil(1498)-N(3))-methyltransferase [Elusimicrobiota bacterium]